MLPRSVTRRTLVLGTAGAAATTLLPHARMAALAQEAEAPADAAEEQVLRIATYELCAPYDPHLSYCVQPIGEKTYFMWAGLVKMDENLEVVPDIATRWEISDDGLRYTFFLDPERTFSDGSPITANDVVWSWTRSLDPATTSVVAGYYFGDVVGANDFFLGEGDASALGFRAVDDLTFEVDLITPKNYFHEILVHPCSFVVKQSDVEAGSPEDPWYAKATAFSGPYAIESYEPDQSLELVANPNYPVPHQIQRLSYRYADNEQTRFLLYENDEVDFVVLGIADAENVLGGSSPYTAELMEQPIWWQNPLYLRSQRPPFDDVRVRRAFAMAIDKQTILDAILGGLNTNLQGVFYPGLDVFNPDLAGPAFDPEAARAELAASSYGGAENLPPMQFYFTDSESEFIPRIAAALAEMWQQNLGVTVELRQVQELDEVTQDDIQIMIGGEALHYPDASNAISFYDCATDDWPQHCDEAWDAKLQQAMTSQDPEESIRLYRELEATMVDDVFIYPLYQRTNYSLVKPRVRNLQTTQMFTFPNFENVYIAAD